MNIMRPDDTNPIPIEQFADENNLTMVIQNPTDKKTAPFRPSGRYEAYFKGCEVACMGYINKMSGWATTEADAINEYAKRISFKQLRTADGKYIEIPDLVVDRSKSPHPQPHHSMNQIQ